MKKRPRKKAAAKSRAARKSPAKSKKAAKSSRPKTTARRQPDIKVLARRWIEDLWDGGDTKVVEDLMAANCIGDTEVGLITGPREFIDKLHAPIAAAFSDLRARVDRIIADDDEAVVRWSIEATHTGDGLGFPASNRRVGFSGVLWLQFKDGKVVGGGDRWNSGALMACLRDGTPSPTVRIIESAPSSASL